MLQSVSNLFEFRVLASDGEIGDVHDFLIDDKAWVIRYFVVDVDAIGRKVLISPAATDQPDSSGRRLPIAFSKDEVKFGSDIEFGRPISRQQETKLHRHYGWPLYWLDKATPDLRNLGLHPHTLVRIIAGTDTESEQLPYHDAVDLNAPATTVTRDEDSGEMGIETEAHTDNSNLRSTKEVIGYGIQARDGAVGHVEDFVIDDNSWTIQLMAVGTRNWLPGNKVLLAPSWIETIRWSEAKVYIPLTQQTIENCPEYSYLPLRKA